MKRSLATIFLFGLLALAASQMVACAPTPTAHANEQPVIAGATPLITDAPPVPSCGNPTPDMAPTCDETARRILASTVRVEFHGPAGGIGHGTIVGGRYLITHNHYPVTAAALNNGGEGGVTAVSILKASGDIILLKAPLSYFKVVREEPQMLLLDFQAYSGVGFFDSLGVPSIEWRNGNVPLLASGSEVAQVNWDGSIARVEWARVAAVHLDSGAATIELDSFVEQGASGGGVFYNGVHIANNWTRQTDRLESGEIVRQYSLAALNPANVLAMTGQ
jgi:hypothetical protein